MFWRGFLALSLGAVSPVFAQTEIDGRTYLCERDVQVPVVYITAPDVQAVVLTADGFQITLYAEPAASGARYGWPSGGSSYVWWTKGDEGTLLWRDGAAGTETPVLTDCRAG